MCLGVSSGVESFTLLPHQASHAHVRAAPEVRGQRGILKECLVACVQERREEATAFPAGVVQVWQSASAGHARVLCRDSAAACHEAGT